MTSRKIAALVVCACLLMIGSVFAQEPELTPMDTPTLVPTDTPTNTDTPSPVPTDTTTDTATMTSTDTATIMPTASSTTSATNTAAPFEPEITAEVTVPVAFDEIPTVTPEMLDPQDFPMNLETLEPWCYFWDFTVSNGGFTPIPAGSGNWVSGQGWVGANITLSSVNRTLAQIQKTFSSTILTRIEFDYYRMEGNINASPPGAIETLAIFINGIRRQVQFFYFASTQGTFSWTGTISNATNVYLESQPSWMSSGGVANGGTRLTNATLRGLGTNPFGMSNCDLPTPTPTPTDTPTLPFCPPEGLALMDGEEAALFSPECQEVTPTATPTLGFCEIDANTTLSDFGINVPDNWTNDPRPVLFASVQATGRALCSQGVGNGNIVAAFRTVMQGQRENGEWRTIEFRQASSAYCSTSPTDDDAMIARIFCGVTGFTITEYTVTHELGHVFALRVPGYYDAITIPDASGNIEDGENQHVFGLQSYNVFILGQLDSLEDWQRSDIINDNGWGSAARWVSSEATPYYDIYNFPTYTPPPTPTPTIASTPFPVRVPRIGPCDDNRVSIEIPNVDAPPGNFQQNPCTYSNAQDVWLPYSVEVEEAAADMFLNWVYWVNGEGGFSNTDWRFQGGTVCYLQAAGCPDAGESGQVRADWMSTQMATMLPPLR